MTRRLVGAGLVVALLLGVVTAAPVLAVASPSSPDTRPDTAADIDGAPQTTPAGFDSTVFEVTTYENGSARWTLRYLRLLENDSQVATFEDYAVEFERTEQQFVRDFRTRAERLTDFGTEATGRNMTATDFRRAAFVRTQIGGAQAVGVVELSFRWDGFAAVREGRVVVADVFDGGMYLGADQRLVLGHGPNLTFGAVDPAADSLAGGTLTDSETVTWVGEQQFSDARPRVTYTQVGDDSGAGAGAGSPTGTATVTPGSDGQTPEAGDPGSGEGSGGDGLSLLSSLVVGLVVLAGLVGLAWYADMLPTDTGDGADSDGPPAGVDGQPATGAGSTQSQQTAPTPTVSDEELLSDEDRVHKLLEGNGGRMRQVDIVDETEWSKSKVSMLLSEMEEAGEISKLRVGRENIISLSGHEPDAAGSPFDEE